MAIPTSVRSAVLARDSRRCRWCGTPTTELHHIVYRSQGGKDVVDNLIALCRPCHAKAHSNKRRYAPLLLACLEFQRQGKSVTVAQVERWANKDRG